MRPDQERSKRVMPLALLSILLTISTHRYVLILRSEEAKEALEFVR